MARDPAHRSKRSILEDLPRDLGVWFLLRTQAEWPRRTPRQCDLQRYRSTSSRASSYGGVPHHLGEIKVAHFSCLRLRGYRQIYADLHKAYAVSGSKMVK